MEIQKMQLGQKFYGPHERIFTYGGTHNQYDPNKTIVVPVHFATYEHGGQTWRQDFRADYVPALVETL